MLPPYPWVRVSHRSPATQLPCLVYLRVSGRNLTWALFQTWLTFGSSNVLKNIYLPLGWIRTGSCRSVDVWDVFWIYYYIQVLTLFSLNLREAMTNVRHRFGTRKTEIKWTMNLRFINGDSVFVMIYPHRNHSGYFLYLLRLRIVNYCSQWEGHS